MKPGWYGMRLTRSREQNLSEILRREHLGGPGEWVRVIDFLASYYLLTARSEAISPGYVEDAAEAAREMARNDRFADKRRVIEFPQAHGISELRKWESADRLSRTGTDDELPF